MASNLAGPAGPQLTPEERLLVTAAQARFPLVARPFASLGKIAGLAEADVISRLRALKEAKIIRKIGPIFEPQHFGLATELIAAEVAPEALDEVAAAVSAWEPVTHCYARSHAANLWFAVVAPNEAWLEWAAAQTSAMKGVKGVWRLPALRRFKISVHFSLSPLPADTPEGNAGQTADREPLPPVTAADIEMLKVIETDLPLSEEPFARLAAAAGLEVPIFLDTLKAWKAQRRLRRYGALMNHRRLGFAANSMTAWAVAGERIEAAGSLLAASPYVSHCYERPPFAPFPYNLYAMIHGHTEDECHAIIAELSQACGLENPAALFSTREFKKTSPNYARLLALRAAPGQG